MCCAVLFAFWLMCFSCKLRRRRMQQFEDLKIDNLYHDDIPIIINNDRRPSQSSTSTWTTYQHQRTRLNNLWKELTRRWVLFRSTERGKNFFWSTWETLESGAKVSLVFHVNSSLRTLRGSKRTLLYWCCRTCESLPNIHMRIEHPNISRKNISIEEQLLNYR